MTLSLTPPLVPMDSLYHQQIFIFSLASLSRSISSLCCLPNFYSISHFVFPGFLSFLMREAIPDVKVKNSLWLVATLLTTHPSLAATVLVIHKWSPVMLSRPPPILR